MDVIIYSASASSWAFIFLDSCLLLSLLSLQLLYIQHLKLSRLPLLTLPAVLENVDRAGFSPCLSTVPSAIVPRINDAPVIPSAQFFFPSKRLFHLPPVHVCASHINHVSWAHICRPAQIYHFITHALTSVVSKKRCTVALWTCSLVQTSLSRTQNLMHQYTLLCEQN